VPRTPKKPRPKMGAHIAALRKAAGLTQAELAKLVGRDPAKRRLLGAGRQAAALDVLAKMAKVLGVRVENLLSPDAVLERRGGPIGRAQKVFETLARLPRRQQDKIIDIVEAFVAQQEGKAS
jgi:transcriptional regulator with XRE-family HTH domain